MISRLQPILLLGAARLSRMMIMGAALLALGLLAGPAGAQQDSGFLSDYSKLSPAADNPSTRLWISKDFDFKPYQKVVLDPVEVWVSPTSQYKGASPEVLKRMTDRFTNAVNPTTS